MSPRWVGGRLARAAQDGDVDLNLRWHDGRLLSLPSCAHSQHCAGVESLLLPAIPQHRMLFTASRDSTVKRWGGRRRRVTVGVADGWGRAHAKAGKGRLLAQPCGCSGRHTSALPAFDDADGPAGRRWNLDGPEPRLEATFEGHADWVNDVALIGDLLVTCSNDQTVRLWKAGSSNGAWRGGWGTEAGGAAGATGGKGWPNNVLLCCRPALRTQASTSTRYRTTRTTSRAWRQHPPRTL